HATRQWGRLMTLTPAPPRTPRRFGRLLAAATATVALAAGAAVGPGVLDHAFAAQSATPAGWDILVYAVNDSSAALPLGLDLDEMINASRSGISFTVYVD